MKSIKKHKESQKSSCLSLSNPRWAFQSMLCSEILQLLMALNPKQFYLQLSQVALGSISWSYATGSSTICHSEQHLSPVGGEGCPQASRDACRCCPQHCASTHWGCLLCRNPAISQGQHNPTPWTTLHHGHGFLCSSCSVGVFHSGTAGVHFACCNSDFSWKLCKKLYTKHAEKTQDREKGMMVKVEGIPSH